VVYEAQAAENLQGKGWTVALASDQLLLASNRNLNIGLKLRVNLRGPCPFQTAPG
jgi:hypothetical protein